MWINNLLVKEAAPVQSISGPEVDAVISVVQQMFNRGAPVEYDFQGFNKIDYQNPVLHKLNGLPLGSEVSIADLDAATRRLWVYQKQMPSVIGIRKMFEAKVKSLQGISSTPGDNTIKVLGPGQYGKVSILIPNSVSIPKRQLNSVLRDTAQKLGWKQEKNNFGGIDYPTYKGFSPNRQMPDIYDVLPSFIPAVSNFLRGLKYNVDALVNFKAEDIANPKTNDPQAGQSPTGHTARKISASATVNEVGDLMVRFDWNKKLGQQFIDQFKQVVDGLKPTGMAYMRESQTWRISGLPGTAYAKLEQFFKDSGYETSFPPPPKDAHGAEITGIRLRVLNISQKGPYHMAFHSPSGNSDSIRQLREQVEEMMRFSFPIDAFLAPDKIGNRIFDNRGQFTGGHGGFYCIKGDFNDYVSFAEILRKKGFDLTEYRKVLAELLESGKVQKMKPDGVLDGYIKKDENGRLLRYPPNYPDPKKVGKFIEDTEQFDNQVDAHYSIKKPGKPPSKLLPPQKECIRHLYSRHSALNGSATGAGKTSFMVVAADMRRKQDGGNGRILVITENGPKQQWVREIRSIAGYNNPTDVSIAPDGVSVWTVMHYNQFGVNIDGEALKAKSRTSLKILQKASTMMNEELGNPAIEVLRAKTREHIDQMPNLTVEQTGFDASQLNLADQFLQEFDIFIQHAVKFASDVQQLKQQNPTNGKLHKIIAVLDGYIKVQMEKVDVFRRMKKGAEMVELINQQKYHILILDECHNVKNDSNQSNNIIAVSQHVPVVWGGSATISANKPIDVYRQLKAIGHNLGHLTFTQFNEAFVGGKSRKITTGNMKEIRVSYDPTDVNAFFRNLVKRIDSSVDKWKANKEGEFPTFVQHVTDLDNAEIMRIATKELKPFADEQVKKVMNLTAWLTLTEVYMSKTKEEINPDIPEHVVQQDEINPTYQEALALDAEVKKMMNNFKDPGLAISEMLAYRKTMAEIKTKYTLERIKPIVQAGKKVLIFTCFKEAGRLLHHGALQLLFKTGKVSELSMGGEDSEDRTAKVDKFKDPKGNTQVLILGILSGGTGIDIPNVTDQVFMNDFDWTPKSATQAEGRAYRVNAEFPVYTNYMVLKNTPDIMFYKQVEKKRNLAKFIQEMDKEFADRVNNNKPVDDLVHKCKETQWGVIQSQVLEKIKMMRWLQSGGTTVATWIGKMMKNGSNEKN